MSHGIFRQTKSKIIVSYVLLFLLSLLGIIFIYKQITRLTVGEEGVSEANQKLFIIGNTITGLYEAESLSNVFLQTGSNTSFSEYIAIMDRVNINIDSLRNLTDQLQQQLRLDSISLLLEEKTGNLRALIAARKSLSSDEFYTKAIASIESGRDSTKSLSTIHRRLVTTYDSTYIKNEKKRKGLLGWLTPGKQQDSALKVTVLQHLITDTLRKSPLLQSTDTLVNVLKSVWEDIQEKQKNINRRISRTEYNIIAQSSDITEQLRRILGEYEKEELNNSFRKIEQREKVVNNTTTIIAWVASIAFLIILLFSFFILRDISRSQRYRRKLENANQYADQLLKSREKMILTVTHDIKSPLSSVIGYIELLNNTPVNERQRYFLKNMQGSSEHILKLIGNLLDLSKLENNKMPVEEVVFRPARLFQEIADNFMPLAVAKKLRLDTKFSEELNNDYKGDALRIRQVITNILSNAVKYTTEGNIGFSATSSTDDKQIILKIRDTGSGMTPEEQKLIFQEFTRLKTHSTIEGTGLGLTITLKLIDLLGGEIRLESSPGKGSCFIIRLPLQKAISPASPTQIAPPAPIIKPGNNGLRILLVDDDPLQLAMTKGLLENRGIYPDSTTHPCEVAGKLESDHYDLVFSDIQMPEMNGFELVRQIRNLPRAFAKTLPIIALSADSDKHEEDYLKAGFSAYLAKPFSSGQLIELIVRLTGKEWQSGQKNANIQPDKPEQTEGEGYTLKHILQFTDQDRSALQKILASFVTSTREHILLLKEYLREQQQEPITLLAHKMLPMFRQMEAKEIITLLQRLEHPEKENLPAEEIKALTQEVIIKTGELTDRIARQELSVH